MNKRKSGKVSKNSVYNVTTRRQGKQYLKKGYTKAKNTWSDQAIDSLLEMFLVDDLHFLGHDDSNPGMVNKCQRTIKAVEKALWRLAVRDVTRKHFADYNPVHRTNRTGTEFTSRDNWMLAVCSNETGIRNKAYDSKWIGMILGRDSMEIEKRFKFLASKNLPKRNYGFVTKNPVEVMKEVEDHLTEAQSTRRVHKALRHLIIAFRKEIARAVAQTTLRNSQS